jgi:hypothetical protein
MAKALLFAGAVIAVVAAIVGLALTAVYAYTWLN